MKPYFEGWYYKHQADGKTLAVIPGRANASAFVQIITDNFSYSVAYPLSEYKKTQDELRVGRNVFTRSGIMLDVRDENFSLSGNLRYGPLMPLRSDIMGLFRFFPMECRHGVVSMRHTVSGNVIMNGEILVFSNGVGYIETDSGRSFPEIYTWVQSNDFSGGEAVMASAAKIPFMGQSFWGCIAVVMLGGREYRLATYLGAKIVCNEPGKLLLRQGRYHLEITAEPEAGESLAAPDHGKMRRTIRENASCPARFRFVKGGHVLFEGECSHASYEYDSSKKQSYT